MNNNRQMYQAIVSVAGASYPLGYTDDKNELLMYYEQVGIQPENVRFIPVEWRS